MVHRDLKPANIMIVPGKRGESVKVVDFGIAKIRSEEGKRTTIPIGRAELIAWIILVPLLLGVVYFFWHHN